jgi:hypothetical protein
MTSTTKVGTQFITNMRNTAAYTSTVEMASTASTDLGAEWAVLPCYGVEWIDIEITVATKSVTVTVTQDYSGGNKILPTQSYVCAASATPYHLLAIVPGCASNLAVTNGSHTVTVTLTSTVGGSAGTCTGKIHLHGLRNM